MDNRPFYAGDLPKPLSSLRFSPAGLYDLRRHLGRPAEFRTYRHRFEAADIAFFAAGLAAMPCDAIGPMDFPPEFNALREETPFGDKGTGVRSALRRRVGQLTCDMAALWDRAFGGTTLVMHVDGTTRPGSLRRADYVKSEVYFPGYLLNLPEHAQISATIADLVQRFISDIGVSTVARYEQRAHLLWELNTNQDTRDPYSTHALQPAAKPADSSLFVYHGRRPVVIVEEEETASQFEIVENPEVTALNKELEDVKAALKCAEEELAASVRREEELQKQLDMLDPSSSSRKAQPTPRTPHRSKASSALFAPSSASPTPASVRSPVTWASRSAQPNVSSDAWQSAGRATTHVSQATASENSSPLNSLADFVGSRGLEHSLKCIDLIRRNVPSFLWQAELTNQLELDQQTLEDLMVAMDAYSASQNDGKNFE